MCTFSTRARSSLLSGAHSDGRMTPRCCHAMSALGGSSSLTPFLATQPRRARACHGAPVACHLAAPHRLPPSYSNILLRLPPLPCPPAQHLHFHCAVEPHAHAGLRGHLQVQRPRGQRATHCGHVARGRAAGRAWRAGAGGGPGARVGGAARTPSLCASWKGAKSHASTLAARHCIDTCD